MELLPLKDVFEFSKTAGANGVLVFVIIFLLYFQNKKDNQNREDKKATDKILSKMLENNIQLLNVLENNTDVLKDTNQRISQESSRILGSIGKTKLPDNQLVYFSKRIVLSACIEKLKFIEEQLELDDIEHNQEEKKKHIKSQLAKFSRELYVDPLNGLTCKRGSIGDWVAREFPFDNFCEEIFRIFFDTKIAKHKKRNLFLNIMMTYQNDLWEEFKIYLDYGM